MSAIETHDPDDVFDWYIDRYIDHQTPKHRDNVTVYLHRFQKYLNRRNLTARDVDINDAKKYLEVLQDEYAPNSQHNYTDAVRVMYKRCNYRNVVGIEVNPIQNALDETDILDDPVEPNRSMISTAEMATYIQSFDQPHFAAPTTLGAKIPRRVGAICNLDLFDVHLDHPVCDWEVAQPIRDKPDFLHFPPYPEKEHEFRGMRRYDSNKTKTQRVAPIDEELKQVLLWYLLVRPGSYEARSPLFKSLGGRTRSDGAFSGKMHHHRLKSNQFRHAMRKRSEALGYYYGGDDPDNVLPHYLRHWVTTKLKQDATFPGALVTYLRGDEGDIDDHYFHWDDEQRDLVTDAMPKFFD